MRFYILRHEISSRPKWVTWQQNAKINYEIIFRWRRWGKRFLCDAGVVLLNDEGKLIFHSPERGINNPKYLPKNWNELTVSEKNKAVRMIYRNTVNEEGNLVGYGVVTGENAAINYLHIGTIELKNNEVIILYTDGYENYFSLEKFLTVFKKWPDDLERQLKSLSNDIIKEKADIYGQERTLIAITV